jgi:hypothetical protein
METCPYPLAGWPTPDANAFNLGEGLETWNARMKILKEKHKNGNGAGMPLQIAALMTAGWPTARATDGSKGQRTLSGVRSELARKGNLDDLPSVAMLSGGPTNTGGPSSVVGWPTPNASDEHWRYSNHDAAMRRLESGKQMSMEAVAHLAGWTTPQANEPDGSPRPSREAAGRKTDYLGRQAHLAGWATPNCMDHLPSSNLENRKKKGGCVNLKDQVAAGWATPTVRDHKDGSSEGTAPVNGLLGRQVWGSGASVSTSPAQTENRGALNPHLSRWLMGYPKSWNLSGQRAAENLKKKSKKK